MLKKNKRQPIEETLNEEHLFLQILLEFANEQMKMITCVTWLMIGCLLMVNVLGSHNWGQYFWEKTPENTDEMTQKLIIPIGNCHTHLDSKLSNSNTNWTMIFSDVIDKWNNVPQFQDGSGVIYHSSSVIFEPVDCDVTNNGIGRIQSFNGDYNDTGWLGIAQLWVFRSGDANIIVKAEARVNEYYIQPIEDGSNYDRFSNPIAWQHVVCQEIGHGFPLGHQSETGADLNTCMDYSTELDNPYPNLHDIEQIDILYGIVTTPSPVVTPSPVTPSPDTQATPSPTTSTTTPSPTTTTTTKPPRGKGNGKGGKNKRNPALRFTTDFGDEVDDGIYEKMVGEFAILTKVIPVEHYHH